MSSAPSRPPRQMDESRNASSMTEAQQFEKSYTEAYKKIDQAITLVTENRHEQATPLFEEGLILLDRALELKVSSQHHMQMQAKMRMTRKEVLQHFASSQLFSGAVGGSGYPVADAPPSYQDSIDGVGNASYPKLPDQELTPLVQLPRPSAPGASAMPLSTSPAANSLTPANLSAPPTPLVTPVLSPQEGELVFRIENGVQIFFIYPDGKVTSPSYPSFLEVVTLNAPLSIPSGGAGSAGGFLQVGEWSYPLVRASSPVLHSFYGAYMFPDLSNTVPGTNVGVIIPDSVSREDRNLFESILTQMTSYHDQQQQTEKPVRHAITSKSTTDGRASQRTLQSNLDSDAESTYLPSGAEAVSTGVVWGAGKMSQILNDWSQKWQEATPPAGADPALPTKKIDPKLQTTAKAARVVSGKAVKVSGYILGQVGKATMALGRRAAPHLQHHGTRALSSLTGQSHKQATDQMSGAMEVAAGAVQGASTVYMGLEKAAETLACSLADNTVKVVTHKYGPEAGELTDNAVYAVGQSAMAGHNIASLGVKGVAKKAAKDTGKALVLTHKEKKQRIQGGEGGDKEVVEGMEVGEEAREAGGFVVVERGLEAMEEQPPPTGSVIVPKDKRVI